MRNSPEILNQSVHNLLEGRDWYEPGIRVYENYSPKGIHLETEGEPHFTVTQTTVVEDGIKIARIEIQPHTGVIFPQISVEINLSVQNCQIRTHQIIVGDDLLTLDKYLERVGKGDNNASLVVAVLNKIIMHISDKLALQVGVLIENIPMGFEEIFTGNCYESADWMGRSFFYINFYPYIPLCGIRRG
ncbi:hypothetical protein H6764_03280 [Candidatus Nomurabacteria bacterium]|nr:hypothetical protein [Candidatus Nomurabacteria bacterium]